MSILANLHHVTRYRYDRPIVLGPQVVRLRPAPHCRTRVVSYSLKVTPAQHFVNWQQDPNGNWLARFVFPENTDEFSITVDLLADMAVVNPFDFFVEPFAESFPFVYPTEFSEELAPFLDAEPAGPRLAAFLASVSRDRRNIVDFLVELNQRLQREIRYLIRMEVGVLTPEETLAAGSGSCRDSAWLLVQILRHLGLAARFVSGYLIQLRPDVTALDGPVGATQDFTDLHAWAEVYIPGAGWIGLDATSGLLCGEGHLPLAATPHFRAAAPISGGVEPAEVKFSFEMSVTRIAEKPRVTYPFSDEAWTALDALGDKVDADLATHDVRLTMGGEPTFVSVDDYQSAEWNTAALGPTKRMRADELIRKLRDRFAPGGLLHYGQGKWYPGEPLPRWAFALYWRRDGKPIWRNAALIATETGGRTPPRADEPGSGRVSSARSRASSDALCARTLEESPRWPLASLASAASADDALRFTASVAARLGIAGDYVQPAFEDPAERMLKEGELAANIDPSNPQIDDPHERARIMRAFERRLSAPAGYVLPVQRWTAQATPGWISEIWRLRRGRLFLLPGDSPIGFRLPLKSLPYFVPADYPHLVPADPFDEHGELVDAAAMAPVLAYRAPDAAAPPIVPGALTAQGASAAVAAPARTSGIPVRTALGGRAARRTAVRVHAAGRAARRLSRAARGRRSDRGGAWACRCMSKATSRRADPRLNVIKVTPDPGVIEVNVHPAASWREAVDITRTLYEDARLSRLGTDKFMIDGRHTGTGGGNHVVLGGLNAADSPFLRRPDLLKSLMLYWQRHPSLSYLFSGLFIGPTSQAPRIDEARQDLLYELEIALATGAGAGRGRAAAAVAGRSPVSQSPGRRHRQHPSRRDLHRQAVLARRRRPVGSGWSNSARSRCRPTRA